MGENESKNVGMGNPTDRNIYEMGLFEKMAAITAELGAVAKNIDVKAGTEKFKAVSERDILDAVKPLEEKYRIYSYPCDREILESEMLKSEKTYQGQTTVKTTFFTRIKTTYKFVNIDRPEDSITMVTFSEGIDTQDKGSGKAMTYADKYALMKAYKISTGDDPDYNGSEPENYQKGNENRQNPPVQPPRYNGPQQGWQAPPTTQPSKGKKSPPIFCEGCKTEILDTPLKDGSIMSKENVVEYSKRNFSDGIFCPDCQRSILQSTRVVREK